MSRRTEELIGAGLIVLFGVGVAVLSLDFQLLLENGQIGPGFMPFLAGSCMVIFGIAVAVEMAKRVPPGGEPGSGRAVPGREDPESADTAPTETAAAQTVDVEAGEPEPTSDDTRPVTLIVFALTLAAVVLAPAIGFLVAFGILIFVLIAVIEREGVVAGLVLSAASVLVVWLVFAQFLRIPLPEGPLGF